MSASVADMARLQFSLRNLMIFVTYLAVAFGLLRAGDTIAGDLPPMLMFWSSIVCVGAGVGALFGKQLVGAAIALLVLAIGIALALFGLAVRQG